MKVIGRTDIGVVRANNEDFIALHNEPIGTLPNLFIIADGMGGHKAGEVASLNSIEFFRQFANENKYRKDNALDFMVEATCYANNKVYELAQTSEEYLGMGTTFSACVFDDGKVFISHVGDSRVYIFGGGKMAQLTIDHTYVNEMVKAGQMTAEDAKQHPNKNIITRALGVGENLSVDAYVYNIYPLDIILICSDGLTDTISEQELYDIIIKDMDIDDKAYKLIELAKFNGSTDNISVVLVEI